MASRLEFPKDILPKLMFPKLVCSKLMFPKRNALKPMAPNSCLQTHVSQTHVSHSRGSKLCMPRAHQPDYHRVFLSFGTPVDLFPHYFSFGIVLATIYFLLGGLGFPSVAVWTVLSRLGRQGPENQKTRHRQWGKIVPVESVPGPSTRNT